MKSNIAFVGRGRIEHLRLKTAICFNGNVITKAIVEIDHIIFGINKKTCKLNGRRRTNFNIGDVEKFLKMLDDENLVARGQKRRVSQFQVRIDCPVQGQFLGREFTMIFDTDYDSPDEVHVITIFPGW
jgi:hypothetical protein